MIKILIAEDEQIEREFINIVKTSQLEICCCRRKRGGGARMYQSISRDRLPRHQYAGIQRPEVQRSAPFPGRPARCSS
ncbi:MAG: hypothetical protein ACLVJX_09885 [Merdibacter sp.]